MKRLVRVAAVTLGLSLVVAGCGGGGSTPEAEKSKTPVVAEQTQVPVPDGVELTDYGTELGFGESANVAYSPNDERQTVLKLTVLSATQGQIADLGGYSLEERTRASTPYYVKVRVENVGQGDVGQTPIPLFLVDNRDTLISASSFTNSFTRCPSTPLPTTFAPKAAAEFCLVYLAPDHGTMTGISFRAVQEFAPILWKGTVTVPKPPKKKGTRS